MLKLGFFFCVCMESEKDFRVCLVDGGNCGVGKEL